MTHVHFMKEAAAHVPPITKEQTYRYISALLGPFFHTAPSLIFVQPAGRMNQLLDVFKFQHDLRGLKNAKDDLDDGHETVSTSISNFKY